MVIVKQFRCRIGERKGHCQFKCVHAGREGSVESQNHFLELLLKYLCCPLAQSCGVMEQRW